MKKGDFIIIGVVALSFVLSIILLVFFQTQGTRVIIEQNNKVIYESIISIDKTIDTGTNTIVIKDSEVYVEKANCSNQHCVEHKKISKKGESILCVPNKVIIEIE